MAAVVVAQNKKEKLERKLNTQGCCFLCLTLVDLKSEVEVESGKDSDINGKATQVAAKEHSSASLRILNRYLNINLEKLHSSKNSTSSLIKESSSSSSVKQAEDPKVDLCGPCGGILDKFTKLFLSLEKIQLEMNYWQRRIHQQISNAWKMPELVQNYSKRMTSDPETLTQLVFVDKLRKEISNMTLEKSKTGQEANVKLKRLDLKVLKKKKKIPVDSSSAMIQTSIAAQQVVASATTEEPQLSHLLKFELQEEYNDDQELLEQSPPNSPPSILSPAPPWRSATYRKKCNDGSDKNLPGQVEVGITSVYNSKTGKYGCTKCKKEFGTGAHARQHYDAIHLRRRWKCDICNSSVFSYPHHLLRHKKTCWDSLQQRLSEFKAKQNDPRYKVACSICGKIFTKHSHMLQHNRTVHLKEKNHACDFCNKTFLTTSNLKVHKNAVHLGITLKCRTCRKQFKYKHVLKEHEGKCENRSGVR